MEAPKLEELDRFTKMGVEEAELMSTKMEAKLGCGDVVRASRVGTKGGESEVAPSF